MNKKREKEESRSVGTKYAALQGNYWILYCCTFSYITFFLAAKGMAAGTIGVLVAAANIVGVILQPVFASLADKGGRFSLKNILIGSGILGIVPAVCLMVMPELLPVVIVMMMIELAIVGIQQPLVNAVSGYYEQQGYRMNFGLGRGIGSLSYAVFSSILGYLVARNGENVIPAAICLFMAAMVVLNLSFPSGYVQKAAPAVHKNMTENSRQEKGLLRKYRSFFLLLFGIVLMFTFHYIVNTYLIQIMGQFGGTSADMGFSLSLAAVCEMPAMFLFAHLVKKVRANQMIRIAALGFMLKALLVWLAGSVMMVHVSQMFQAVSFAVLIPASVYYSDEIMEEQDRVKGQAFITAAIAIGGVVGNLIGGVLIDWKGVPVTLLLGVIFAALGLVFMWIGAVPPKKAR